MAYKGFKDIEQNAFCGIQIPKRLIPQQYIKKFSIKNIEKYVDLKIPTLYAYLSDLVNMGLLKKRRIGRNLSYKINIDRETLFTFMDNIPYKDIYYSIFLDSWSNDMPVKLQKQRFSVFRIV